MSAPEFGPVRWDPNDLLRLRRDAEWRAVMEATGDAEPATDVVVIHEPSAYERGWRPIAMRPTNLTPLIEAAPVLSRRSADGLRSGLFLLVLVPAVAYGIWWLALVVTR